MLFHYLFQIIQTLDLKRKFYGQKIINFLVNFSEFLAGIFSQKMTKNYFGFLTILFFVFVAVFLRLKTDLAANSSYLLQWLIDDGVTNSAKNFLHFQKNNSLADFSASSILAAQGLILLSKIISIKVVILAKLWPIFLAVFSAFLIRRNLIRVNFNQDQKLKNFLFISFLTAIFTPIFLIDYNEVFSNSLLFLLIFLPYFSFIFLSQQKLKISDFLLKNILLILLIFVDPAFVSVVLALEIYSLILFLEKEEKFFHQEKLKFYLAFICSILAAFLAFFIEIKLLKNANLSVDEYLNFSFANLFETLKYKVSLLIAIFLLSKFLLKKYQFLREIFFLNFTAILFLLLAKNYDIYELESVFYSLSFVVILLISYLLIIERKIDFRSNWIILFLIFFLPPQALPDFALFTFDLVMFWWILALIFLLIFSKNDFRNLEKLPALEKNFFAQIFIKKNPLQIAILVAAILGFLALVIDNIHQEITWFFAFVATLFLVIFYEKIWQIFSAQKSVNSQKNQQLKNSFSRPYLFTLALLISYIFALYFSSIFGLKNFDYWSKKSPNLINEKLTQIIDEKQIKSDEILVISNIKNTANPLLLNLSLSDQFAGIKVGKSDQKIAEILQQKIFAKEIKIIVIESDQSVFLDRCSINLLEYYQQLNQELVAVFAKNYVLLQTIEQTDEVQRKARFYSDSTLDFYEKYLPKINQNIVRQVQVFVKQNNN